MAITILLIVKIIFFGSLVGIVYMLLSKVSQVKALSEATAIDGGGLVLPLDLSRLKELGLSAPARARQLLNKEREALVKQIKAIRFFSEQKIVYHFRKIKAQAVKPPNQTVGPTSECHTFEDDYWHKVNKQ